MNSNTSKVTSSSSSFLTCCNVYGFLVRYSCSILVLLQTRLIISWSKNFCTWIIVVVQEFHFLCLITLFSLIFIESYRIRAMGPFEPILRHSHPLREVERSNFLFDQKSYFFVGRLYCNKRLV